MDTEGVENRVLYTTSKDAVTWSQPAVMFNSTGSVGVENEPQVLILGERLYSIAGSWDVNNSEYDHSPFPSQKCIASAV